MNLKEIAQKLAPGYWKRDQWNMEYFDSVGFAEALIESYKAELLKEVGEPVLYAEFAEDGGWLGDASEYADHLEEPHALFTSDQVAAAILKATGPLEERRCEICGYAEHHREHTSCLRTQLAAAQEENGRLENQVLARDAELWGRTQEILGLKDQLAKAEQRVAEACALYIHSTKGAVGSINMAEAVLSGEWRKFVKEAGFCESSGTIPSFDLFTERFAAIIEKRTIERCAIPDNALQAIKDACSEAMHYTLAARIPECGNFGEIAQNLSFALQEIATIRKLGEQ